MLSAVDERGRVAAAAAVARARQRVAEVLRDALPGIAVTIEEDSVVLSGAISPDDARLRWIGSMLR